MPAILDGHPDDWWGGHDWDLWWSLLAPGDRDRLLDQGQGDEPAPWLDILLTSLRGAVCESRETVARVVCGQDVTVTVTVRRASDEFVIWLDEKRAERDQA